MRAAGLLTAAALVCATGTAATGGHLREDDGALELLARMGQGLHHPHVGEALQVVWGPGGSRAALAHVRSAGGELTVEADERWTVRLGEGGGLVDHAEGWHVPFPQLRPEQGSDPMRLLQGKYRASLGSHRQVAGRTCRAVELRLRSGGRLRERLCVDEVTGLVLRRETYGTAGRPVRLATYLSIDDHPAPRGRQRAARGRTEPAPIPLVQHEHRATSVPEEQLGDLRSAGWSVPDELPGGYQPAGAYTLAVGRDAPLQLVFADGVYTVSLFQQPGSPDWEALPAGGQPVEGMGPHAREWPGVMPQRLVWEADGFTYSLVGDAPPDELAAIAQSLPRPAEPSFGERVGRGLARMWHVVSSRWSRDRREH